MTITENYFYFNFKKSKSICNLLNIENSSDLDILEDKIIQLLKEDIFSLLNLCLKNKNIIFNIILIFCNKEEKIEKTLILNFLNKILLEDKINKKEIENFLLKIYQDRFFTDVKANFLLTNLFYENNISKNEYKISDFMSDIELLSLKEIIGKYNILEKTNIYYFLENYKNIIESDKIIYEELMKTIFDNSIKPNLIYLKNSKIIYRKIIEFFSNSKDYKIYLSKILDVIVDKDYILNFTKDILQYKIPKYCQDFIIFYTKNKGYDILFSNNGDREKFWKDYFVYIEKVDRYEFHNLTCYAIYFNYIVVIEFNPIGSIFFYRRDDFENITKKGIYFEYQLKIKRLYLHKINHTSGWQIKVREILKFYDIKII